MIIYGLNLQFTISILSSIISGQTAPIPHPTRISKPNHIQLREMKAKKKPLGQFHFEGFEFGNGVGAVTIHVNSEVL